MYREKAPGVQYRDFQLLIEPIGGAAGGSYRARVQSPSHGPDEARFDLPLSPQQIENLILRMGCSRRRAVRRIDSPELQAAKTLGGELFRAVFRDNVKLNFTQSLDYAKAAGEGLRIRLQLPRTTDLADIPWEYLYDDDTDRFLLHSTSTPLVRSLDIRGEITPLRIPPPLRILAVAATPVTHQPLDGTGELAFLREALQAAGPTRAVLTELKGERATWAELCREIRSGAYHVLHFIGHGDYDEQGESGYLVFEDANGRGHSVSAELLRVLLRDHPTMRLVVLNACEGARTSRADPFAGTAQTLMRDGVPALVAMQFEITDAAAVTFARAFYGAVCRGVPVDAAVAEARLDLVLGGNQVEWGTPVLYLRAPDGRIFDVDSAAPQVAARRSGETAAAGAPPRPPTPVSALAPSPQASKSSGPNASTPAGLSAPVRTDQRPAAPARSDDRDARSRPRPAYTEESTILGGLLWGALRGVAMLGVLGWGALTGVAVALFSVAYLRIAVGFVPLDLRSFADGAAYGAGAFAGMMFGWRRYGSIVIGVGGAAAGLFLASRLATLWASWVPALGVEDWLAWLGGIAAALLAVRHRLPRLFLRRSLMRSLRAGFAAAVVTGAVFLVQSADASGRPNWATATMVACLTIIISLVAAAWLVRHPPSSGSGRW